ncbi:hypothetical protein EYC80_001914 [Monilinia laxa]|uniref:Uncharacterized protein n=1 Tax=Monilinia laxa TaxID=61186 RepID=A0A5N6K6G5_MONLA|nr:hypothetical protein EYC80_001914 [Monilinia laxa]
MTSNIDPTINEAGERFHEGKENSHLALDSKDERSIANKLAREEQREHEPVEMTREERAAKQDATLPAKLHGNEPSKGATIDQQLREEEEAEKESHTHRCIMGIIGSVTYQWSYDMGWKIPLYFISRQWQ